MDKQLVFTKLESLRKCLLRLQEKAPISAEFLVDDIDLQEVIALNLSRAVQISVDISAHVISDLDVTMPNTMGKTFDALHEAKIIDETTALNLKKVGGFRNIAVHNYDIAVHNYERINWLIVHAITQNNLTDFQAFAK